MEKRQYRNLFLELGKTQEEIKQKIQACAADFFESDNRVYEKVEPDMAYIQDTGNVDVRTEGMSYGMMMCVQLDRKEDFDRLWKWTKTYMWMDSGVNEGYFAWSCGLDGKKNAHGPAPDGEEFFAMALFFASNRWGDGEGIFQYSKEAKDILRACLHKGQNGRDGAPMWNHENHQILFVPGSPFTDPSYHLPHFYELFALWAYEEDRPFWAQCVKASRAYLAKACDPVTGMSPEYATFEGVPFTPPNWGGRHDWFYSDAYRTAANIGLDYEWFGDDQGQAIAPQKLIEFYTNHQKGDTFNIYEIDGTEIDQEVLHPVGLIAATAQGALALKTQTKESLAWLQRFWDQPMRTGERRYYDNCLYLFAMLALSGEYRMYGIRSFPILRNKDVVGSPTPGGTGVHMIFLDGGRLPGFAEFAGNIHEPTILKSLESAQGFKSLYKGIGVTLKPKTDVSSVRAVWQMYGKTVRYEGGSVHAMDVATNGQEHYLEFTEDSWSDEDDLPGQLRFEFPKAGDIAVATVVLYLKDSYLIPAVQDENPVMRDQKPYQDMIASSLMQVGNTTRLQKLFEKVKNGEEVTLAFIGGSITQGAGATPIQEGCYARRTYEGFITLMEELLGKKLDRNLIHYRKVGVGGTPSELGMVRYERDILKHGEITPDLVVVEFAVNDADDETHGICFESLVRTILLSENAPAVMLMFSVFADCWNLQDHLGPVGVAYDLPMVSAKDAVAVQFDAVGDKRLVTRNQYFFDKLHPSNVGHNIMADGLLYAMRQAYHIPASPEKDVAAVTPVFGNTFVNIHLLDRFSGYEKAQITEGSFTATDTHLQSVEKDFDPHTTPEFQYNWMHQTGSEAFKLQITCKSLVLVFKDSDSAACGKCDVVVNGEKIKTLDPRQVGWVHAHAVILIDSKEEKSHTVELSMVSGDEEKEFTILGFGYTN